MSTLIEQVRARLGSPDDGAHCVVRFTRDVLDATAPGGWEIQWMRVYPDGAVSDMRHADGDSEETCLRAVLAHEDAADARDEG